MDKTKIFILISKYKSQVIELINLTLNLKTKKFNLKIIIPIGK